MFKRGSAPWALTTVSLAVLMPSLDTSIANVALPTMAHEFSASFQTVQWIVLAYLLAVTTLIVGAGRLGDVVGRRRLLLAGIGLFTGASLLCGVAPVLSVLIVARAAQGLGAAMMLSSTMALAGDTVPKNQAGTAMGLLGSMSAIGTTLGPSLGGALIAGYGWRAVFLVNVPLGLLNGLLAYRHIPADRLGAKRRPVGLDVTGMLLMAVTLCAYALAMTVGRGTFGSLNIALLLASAGGAGLFVLAESNAGAPLVRLDIFHRPALSAGFAMNVLVSAVMMATLVVGPFYLARTLGLTPATTGIVMSMGPLVAALTGVPAGRLVDRVGPSRITLAGLAAMTVGCVVLSILPVMGVSGYVGPLAVATSGYALFQAANNTSVMVDSHPDERGVIAGLLTLSRNLGLITGASVMGAVFVHTSGAMEIAAADPAAIARGMRTTFAVAAALLAAALGLAVCTRARGSRSPASAVSPAPELPFEVNSVRFDTHNQPLRRES